MRKPVDADEVLGLLPLLEPLLPMAELGGWTERARCTQTDQELWFPAKGDPGTPARAICGECDVRLECLAYAVRADEHGIWGGLNRTERRRLLDAYFARHLPVRNSAKGVA